MGSCCMAWAEDSPKLSCLEELTVDGTRWLSVLKTAYTMWKAQHNGSLNSVPRAFENNTLCKIWGANKVYNGRMRKKRMNKNFALELALKLRLVWTSKMVYSNQFKFVRLIVATKLAKTALSHLLYTSCNKSLREDIHEPMRERHTVNHIELEN